MKPTDEQQRVIDLFGTGKDVAVEAGAGTGKTSTMVLIGKVAEGEGRYFAFNKSIADDAGTKMPTNVQASTIHKYAYDAEGYKYKARGKVDRQKSDFLARTLGSRSTVVRYDGKDKKLTAEFMASLAVSAVDNFCNSADEEPHVRHVPYINAIDEPDSDGNRTWHNNHLVRESVLPVMERAWRDYSSPKGVLKITPSHWLKFWQQRNPRIEADFILFDEAQDASPVIIAALAAQDAQMIWVGDSCQQIYEWRGAVNALAQVPVDERTFLTQSFRFGTAIAEMANRVLVELDAPLRLRGLESLPSCVEVMSPTIAPHAVLTRTNAGALQETFMYQNLGHRVHMMGDRSYITSFLVGAGALMKGQRTDFHDLACFTSWDEVKEYVSKDPRGSELRLMTSLIATHGVSRLFDALKSMPKDEKDAELVISTAHKAKGREWPVVKLGGDFAAKKGDVDELRLLYVAATRAKSQLYVGDCDPLRRLWTGQPLETREPV